MSTKTRVSERLEMPQRGQVLRATYLQRMARVINDVVLHGPRDDDGGVEAFADGAIALDEQPDDAQYDTVSVPIVETDDEPAVEVRRQRVVVLIEEGTGRRHTWRLVPPDDEEVV